MTYVLWSIRSGNSIARFDSEAVALQAVRSLVSARGQEAANTVVLAGYRDEDDEAAVTWSGSELLTKLELAHV